MKIDKNVTTRMGNFSKRLRDMRQSLIAAHQQLQMVAAHKDFSHVGVTVGDLADDEFKVTFAGVEIVVRLLPEMSDTGATNAKLSFYEKTRQPAEPERVIGSIKMKQDGTTDFVDEDGDPLPDWTLYLMEAVLQMCEKVLKKRAGAQAKVGGLSL